MEIYDDWCVFVCVCVFSVELHCAALSLASRLVVHLARKTPLVRKTSGNEGVWKRERGPLCGSHCLSSVYNRLYVVSLTFISYVQTFLRSYPSIQSAPELLAPFMKIIKE